MAERPLPEMPVVPVTELIEESEQRILKKVSNNQVYARHARLHEQDGQDPLRTPTHDHSGTGSGGASLAALKYGDGQPDGPNALQILTTTGSPTGGTFKLDYAGQVTANVDWDASAADVQAALEGLSNIGVGDVDCFGSDDLPAGTIAISFQGALAEQVIAAITINTNALTGGSSPTPVIEVMEVGAADVTGADFAGLFADSDGDFVGLWVNLGTHTTPDWKPVSKMVAVDSDGRQRTTVNLAATGDLSMTTQDDSGRESTNLDMSDNDITFLFSVDGVEVARTRMNDSGFRAQLNDANEDTSGAIQTIEEGIEVEGSGGTIRARLNNLGLQLASGTDLLMYSDAFSTLEATWDGATGHIGIGTAPSDRIFLNLSETFTDPSGGVSGIACGPTFAMTGNNANTFRSFSTASTITGAFTLSGIVHNLFAQTTLGTSGMTVNDLRQLEAILTLAAGTTMVDRYGVRVRDATGTGTLTNQYGVYIENLDYATTNRAIQSLGGISTHLGAWGFGSNTAPTNVTNGDLTAIRLIVPNATILHSAVVQLGGPVVIPTAGALRFSDADNSHYTAFKAHDTTTTSETYVLPAADGSADDFLQTDGAGNLTWAAGGAGSGDVATDTIWDAAGDLAVGTGANTAARLAIGAANSVLKSNGTTAAWAVAVPAWSKVIRAEEFHPAHTRTNPAPPPQTNDSGSNDISYRAIPFDGASEEYAAVNFIMPSNWDLSTFTAKYHWTALSGSGDVLWGCRAVAVREGDPINTAMGTAVLVTDTLTTAGDIHVSAASSAITVGGTAGAGCHLFVEVYRDGDAAGDTLNSVDALLLGVELIFGLTGATVT